jgi:uncharacterized protein YydD (DUF2326 family)
MIHRIYSDLPTFKDLRFKQGFNLLLAEKSVGATDRQTRNRAGKTSIIELIHFLAGGNCDKGSIFRTEALVNFSFGIEFDLAGSRTIIERSGQKPSKIIIQSGSTEDWPVTPHLEKDTGNSVISNSDWRTVLGARIFGLKTVEDEPHADKSGPTFRSLFPYFVRRQEAGGFVSPFKHTEQQVPGEQQVAISYLLGLDWAISQKWQQVREREVTLKSLRKAAGEGTLGSVISTTAELRTKLVVAEERSRQMRETLNGFQVLPEYHELEMEASQITRQLGSLADENTVDRHSLAELEQSLEQETLPAYSDLDRLYSEIGIVLPDKAVRRFDEVRQFHESVTQNRKSYLSGEIESTKNRLTARGEAMRRLDSRRADIMGILKAHGALEHFSRLQSELSRLEAESESLRHQFSASERLEGQKTELEIERGQLLLRLQQDFHEQARVLQRAILAFEQTSRALYEDAGSLTIKESLNGPQFEISIQGARSKGISNMQIFCFDIMLMKVCAERGIRPGFLVHDSHLFDGVDTRQVAKAFQVGSKTAVDLGFQYIVTMNSDVLPQEFPSNFRVQDYALPVQLSDATDNGGLFGIRFG